MKIDGTLLKCPLCQKTPKPQILGRLYDNGDLLVLRFHSGTTIIRGISKSVSCGCGYTYHIEGTAIEGTFVVQV